MAALIGTVSNLSPNVQHVSLGNLKAKLVKVTFDSGTDAGGAALVAADFGLSEILLVMPFTDAGDNGTVVGAGWVPMYNYVTGKLQIFGGAASTDDLAESDESLADVQVRCLVIGW